MKPATPTEAEVQAAANALLAEARDGTARPTVSALARRAGIARPTLYRNHPGLVERFTTQALSNRPTAPPKSRAIHELHDRITKLRHENEELRLHLDLYEEHIRRLTIQNTKLSDQLARAGVVTDLTARRQRNDQTPVTPTSAS